MSSAYDRAFDLYHDKKMKSEVQLPKAKEVTPMRFRELELLSQVQQKQSNLHMRIKSDASSPVYKVDPPF